LLDVFYPENGGGMFLRNIGWLSTAYTALYHRTLHNRRCENLSSYIATMPLGSNNQAAFAIEKGLSAHVFLLL
jgi:hypothetical protein